METNTDGGGPLILITNDDGIDAHGIRVLTSSLNGLGTRYVVAPREEQSGVSHAITIRQPVRIVQRDGGVFGEGVEAYAVTGTPADCVKMAIDHILPRKPDLVVSGINQGPNAAVNILYSGTVSAALEASVMGLDAIAFSLNAWTGGDFESAGAYARRIVETALQRKLPSGVLLNVNVPNLPYNEIKGIAITAQAKSRWEDSFVEHRDPFDRPYYWIAGNFVNLDTGDHTDLAALEAGYVSVTPVHSDLTAYEFVDHLKGWGM
ncbi:MAG: 5'/3'-nucleotidase SurE [Rhodothermales bacterium]